MKKKSDKHIYAEMQRFANITKTLIMQGNMERVKHCLQVAEEIYIHGTNKIKNVVSNVYVFSVSCHMEINHIDAKEMFPTHLKKEYIQQLNTSGI